MPSTDHGTSSQGFHQSYHAAGEPNINLPQSPISSTGTQTPSSELLADETMTMKITPVKATIVRKHTKQLFRRRDVEEEVESLSFITAASNLSKPSASLKNPPPSKSAALCSLLPDDLICKVTSFLDVASLLHVRKCSRYLRDLASRNEAGWECLCKKLWADKAHVPSVAEALTPSYFMSAYHNSIQDAHERQHLTMEELCYDPEKNTGVVWSFRFKESAGADWTAADPWHCGLPCRKMVFLRDGSVRQYVPANNSESLKASQTSSSMASSSQRSNSEVSDSESSLPELISPNFGALLDTQQQPDNPPPGRLVPPPLSMAWRMLTRPMDLPTRPMGSYVRFSVGGREVPTYSVRRSPTGNWGFLMESCWGLYCSFEPPPKLPPSGANDRRRLRRTETGARWVEVLDNGEETLSSSQHGGGGSRSAQHQNEAALMDDASLTITNEIQWREAFLYNVGARVLPEGDDATDEFDRAFRGTLTR